MYCYSPYLQTPSEGLAYRVDVNLKSKHENIYALISRVLKELPAAGNVRDCKTNVRNWII
jgi:hypothetical protein